MKTIIRVLCLVLALSLFALMALGSGSSDGGSEIVPNSTVAQGGSGNNSAADSVTIEEQVLLERDGIKITAKEYVDDPIWGEGIKILIENNSGKNVGVGCNALIVNNYMITGLFSSSVAAGKKANETLYISSYELEAAGIESIGQVEIYFYVYDSDSYDTLFEAGCVTIKTSAFSKMDVTPSDTGLELYNKDGVRIVGKVVDENSFWGTAVLLYLENNSNRNIGVSCENMSINGFMVSPFFISTIYEGKMAIDEITIFASDLDENDIEVIENIELSFHLYDADSYLTIADTGPISFSVNKSE